MLLGSDGRAYIGTRPSRKSVAKICRAISEATSRQKLLTDAENKVECLNRLMVGWANYFCLGPVSKAYGSVDAHARTRLRWWLCNKHRHKGRGTARFPDERLYKEIRLIRLSVRTRDLPWANA